MKLPTGHDLAYNFGDIVYLRTDSEQKERIIVEICLYPNGTVQYACILGYDKSWHYDFELTVERDLIKTFNN